jgi:hypothetical protein
MGKFHPSAGYTGTVGNVSIYTVRGSDKPVVRTKGGPTKRQIKTKASFATTRKNNMEFGGRARIAGQVMDALRLFKYLSDYNIAGPLNSLFIPIQALDTEHEHGQRDVVLSKNPGLLQGFNLNRRTPFNTIIANPLEYTLSKETLSASVTFPSLMPGINFFNPGKYSWYRLLVTIGIIEDMFYDPKGYHPQHGEVVYSWAEEATDWLPMAYSPAFSIPLNKLRNSYANVLKESRLNSHSLLLGVGIAFGAMSNGHIEMVKYVGGAKVLGMA